MAGLSRRWCPVSSRAVAAHAVTHSKTRGGLPEWSKGAVCKTAGSAYVGSNPTPATHVGTPQNLGGSIRNSQAASGGLDSGSQNVSESRMAGYAVGGSCTSVPGTTASNSYRRSSTSRTRWKPVALPPALTMRKSTAAAPR
jgi:hypothetical protein